MKVSIDLTSEEAEMIAFLIEEELRAKDEITWGLSREQLEKLLTKFNDLTVKLQEKKL